MTDDSIDYNFRYKITYNVIEWRTEINESTSSWSRREPPQHTPYTQAHTYYIYIKQSCIIWINFSTVITLIRLIWDNFTGTWFIHAHIFCRVHIHINQVVVVYYTMCILHIHTYAYAHAYRVGLCSYNFRMTVLRGQFVKGGGGYLIRSKKTLAYFVFVSFGRARKTNEHNWNWYVNETFKYHKSLISIQGGPFEWEKTVN